MIDETLRIGPVTGNRPAALVGLGFQPALFPETTTPDWMDLLKLIDLARVKPVFLNFHIITAFTGPAGAANNFVRFAAWALAGGDALPGFPTELLTDPTTCILARSHPYASAGLQTETEKGGLSRTQGQIVQIALPPISDLMRVVAEGRRYLVAGYEADVPTDDWTAGAVKCYPTHDPIPTKPMQYAAGF